MQITAAVLTTRAQPFELKTLTLAEPGPGQLRVKIHAVGICQTDLSIADHDYGTPLPMVLGHEGAGIVEAIGPDVTHVAPGDRVVLSYASCGGCPACRRRDPQYCANFLALNWGGLLPDGRPPFMDGDTPVFGAFFGQSSFASHALALASNTVKVDGGEVPFPILAPLGCGMQTGAGTVLNTLRPAAGQSFAVFGSGSVGLAGLMAAIDAGCAPVIAVDRDAGRLELARSLGATHVLLADGQDLGAAVHAIVPDGLDFAMDTTGAAAIGRAAFETLAARGTLALVAVPGPGAEIMLPAGHFLGGRKVIGAVEGDADPQLFIPELVARHRAGRFALDRLVTTYPFAAINEAVADMKAGRTVKPVLVF